MTYSLADLDKEITDKIEAAKAAGQEEIVADWIAHSVMSSHPSLSGDDSDFYTVCSYRTVREATRRAMAEYQKGAVEQERQQTLEGFKRLQTHYVVERKAAGNGPKQIMVHVSLMTYEELTAKADEHFAMQRAHEEHANEIIRFRDDKFRELAA